MRIAIFSGDIPAPTFIERLISGLAAQDFELVIIGKKKGHVNYPKNVRVVGYANSFEKRYLIIKYFLLLLFTRFRTLKLLFASIQNINTDKRYTYSMLAFYLPVVYYKPDIFHMQWVKTINDWLWVKKLGVKFILSLRGTHITYSPIVDERIANHYRECFPQINAFHAVSDAIAVEGKKYGANNITTVYSGLDLVQYPFVKDKPQGEILQILSVGRFHYIKGYNYAIDAIKYLKENGLRFHYTIIGGAPPEEILFNINDLGLSENITLVDHMPHDKLPGYFYDTDILLLPSIQEGIANVVLEAMALGTVVVSTDCGGMKEVIKDGENGFLVEPMSSLAIANGILRASKLSSEKKASIREKARLTIETNHITSKLVNGIAGLYKSALNES